MLYIGGGPATNIVCAKEVYPKANKYYVRANKTEDRCKCSFSLRVRNSTKSSEY